MTFKMWSIGHYIFLLSPFIVFAILYYLTRHHSLEKNRILGIRISIFAIIILLLRNIEIFFIRDFQFDIEYLPLQVCHFANFVLLIAFYTRKQTWFNFALILNLPAAFVSILFANGLEGYDTILSFRGFAYIVGHMLIVTLPLWAYAVGFIKLNFKTFYKTVVLVGILYASSFIVNNLMYLLFDQYSNYFYSLNPAGGTPLETFYNLGKTFYLFDRIKVNPLYMVLTGIFAFLIMSVLYLIFYIHQHQLIEKYFKKETPLPSE